MTDNIPDYKLPACEGYGMFEPKYMFIGISGGRLGCLDTGVPFTKDMSGRLFQRAMYRLGYSSTGDETTVKPVYSGIYVTNLVKGKILDSKGLNRAPKNHEIRYWMGDLLDEIVLVKPQKIVAVGSVVYDYLKDETWGDGLYDATLLKVKHPSWYGRKGALKNNSQAWIDMLEEYRYVLGENK